MDIPAGFEPDDIPAGFEPVETVPAQPSGAITAGIRSAAGEIVPALGGAAAARAGAALGIAAGAAIPGLGETGISELVGGVVGAIGGYLAGDAAIAKLQHEGATLVMGKDWADQQHAIDIANLQAHPFTTGIGQMFGSLPALTAGAGVTAAAEVATKLTADVATQAPKFYKSAKVMRVIESGISGAALQGGQAVEAKIENMPGSQDISIPGEVFKGFALMGPLGLAGPAKTVLGRMLGRPILDSAALGFGSMAYDTVIRGKPFDLSQAVSQTGENIPMFVAMAAFMELTHGRGAEALLARLRPPEDIVAAKATKDAIRAKYATGTDTVGENVMSQEDVETLAKAENVLAGTEPVPTKEEIAVEDADVEAKRASIDTEIDDLERRQGELAKSMAEPTVWAASVPETIVADRLLAAASDAPLEQRRQAAVRVADSLQPGDAVGGAVVEELLDNGQAKVAGGQVVDVASEIQAGKPIESADEGTQAQLAQAKLAGQTRIDSLQAAREVLTQSQEAKVQALEQDATDRERGQSLQSPDVIAAIENVNRLEGAPNPDKAQIVAAKKAVRDLLDRKIEDRGVELPEEVRPLVDQWKTLAESQSPEATPNRQAIEDQIIQKLLPEAEVETYKRRRFVSKELAKPLDQYAPKEVAAQKTKAALQTAYAKVQVLANKLGMNIELKQVNRERTLRPEAPEGRQALFDAGKTEEEINEAISKGEIIAVRGACRTVDGRGVRPKRSILTLYRGHKPVNVYHEFAHAVDQQSESGGATGREGEVRAVQWADALMRGDEASVPELTEQGSKIAKPKPKPVVAADDSPLGRAKKKVEDARRVRKIAAKRLKRALEAEAKARAAGETYEKGKLRRLASEHSAAKVDLRNAISEQVELQRNLEKEAKLATKQAAKTAKAEARARGQYVGGEKYTQTYTDPKTGATSKVARVAQPGQERPNLRARDRTLSNGQIFSEVVKAAYAVPGLSYEVNRIYGALQEARSKVQQQMFTDVRLYGKFRAFKGGGQEEDVWQNLGSVYPKDYKGNNFSNATVRAMDNFVAGKAPTSAEAEEVYRVIKTAEASNAVLADEIAMREDDVERQAIQAEQDALDAKDDAEIPGEEEGPFSVELTLDSPSDEDFRREQRRKEMLAKLDAIQSAKERRRTRATTGDLGQGLLFPEEQPELFQPPSPRPNGRADETPLFPEQLAIDIVAEDDEDATGIRRELLNAEREDSGLPAWEAVVKRAHAEVADEVIRRIVANKFATEELVQSLKLKPRALDDMDVGMLLVHKTMITQNADRLASDMERVQSGDRPDVAFAAEVDARRIKQNEVIADFYEVLKPGGSVTMTARGLRMLSAMMKPDYSITSNRSRLTVARRGAVLTPEQIKLADDTAKADRELQAKAEVNRKKLEAPVIAAESKARAASQRVADERQYAANKTEVVTESKTRQDWISRREAALARIAARRAGGPGVGLAPAKPSEQLAVEVVSPAVSPALPPEDLADYAEIGACEIVAGESDPDAWEARMISLLGEDARPYLGQIREASMRLIGAEESRPVSKVPDRNQVLREMAESVDEEGGEGEGLDFAKQIKLLMRAEAEDGVENVDQAVRNVYDRIAPFYPEASEEEVRNAFSDYGKSTPSSSEEVETKLSAWRSLSQKTGQLIDVLSGGRRLPTGKQRREETRPEAAIRKQVYEEEKKLGLPATPEEEARYLKSAQETQLTRARNRITDLIARFNVGGKEEGKEPIPYTETAAIYKAAADDLSAVLKEMEGKPELTPEQRMRIMETALERSNAKLETDIKNIGKELAGEGVPEEPTPTPVTSPKIEALRARREELNSIRAELKTIQNVPPTEEDIRLRNLKKQMDRQVRELERRMKEGDYAPAKPRTPVPLDKEGFEIQAKLKEVHDKFDAEVRKYEREHETWTEKLWRRFEEPFLLSRSILSAFDLSAPFRQGMVPTLAHPFIASKSFLPMLKAAQSEHAAYLIDQEIRNRPNAKYYDRAELFIADWSDELSRQEENYMSRLVGKIPFFKGSNRAYVTFLNKIRADLFDALVGSVHDPRAPTEEELKAIGNYVNISTGRGYLGKHAMAAQSMSLLLWSPRLLTSRFQYLFFQPFYHGTRETRIAIGKEYARTLVGISVVYALGKLLGGDEEWNPRSSDFGKIKWGTTRIDPMAGLSQVTVFLSRMATGETKTAAGDVITIRGPKAKFGADMQDVFARFVRSKLSPLTGTLADFVTGKNYVGDPVTVVSAAKNLAVPLSWTDTYDLMVHQGVAGGTAFTMLSVLGMGVQDYEAKAKKAKVTKAKQRKKTTATARTKAAVTRFVASRHGKKKVQP